MHLHVKARYVLRPPWQYTWWTTAQNALWFQMGFPIFHLLLHTRKMPPRKSHLALVLIRKTFQGVSVYFSLSSEMIRKSTSTQTCVWFYVFACIWCIHVKVRYLGRLLKTIVVCITTSGIEFRIFRDDKVSQRAPFVYTYLYVGVQVRPICQDSGRDTAGDMCVCAGVGCLALFYPHERYYFEWVYKSVWIRFLAEVNNA